MYVYIKLNIIFIVGSQSEYTATQKLFGYGMQHDVEPVNAFFC